MNQRPGVLSLFLVLCAACGPGDTSSVSDDWQLDDRMDMGGVDASADMLVSPDQGTAPVDQGMMNPVDQGAPPMTCGDGIVTGEEVCDGDCPVDVANCPAPPPEACARVRIEGSAAMCDAQCVGYQQDVCLDDDGCCPAGCSQDEDNDCSGVELCGNGELDDGESCDGDCFQDAAECPEPPLADVCSRVVLSGSADMCDVKCAVEVITEFDDFDGCCPMGGTPQLDSDCIITPMCGNGVVESGESCDGDCPMADTDCDDLNACTTDVVAGDASMCSAMCGAISITACMDNDGCCAPGCAGQDSDCDEADLCNVPVPVPLNYSPASIIDSLVLGDGSVGFDFTGDGSVNNGLGVALDQLGVLLGLSRTDYNQIVAAQIASGDLAIVLEHVPLTGLVGPATFSINMLKGEPQCFTSPNPAGTNFYRIDPTSYNAQGAPVSVIAPALMDSQRQITATSNTTVVLPVELLGLPLDLPLEQTRLTSTVNTSSSALPDVGVALDSGLLGGYVKTTSIFDAMSDVVDRDCSCIMRPANTRLITYTMIDGSDATCNSGFNASQCGGAQSVCSDIVNNCGLFTQFVPSLADVDSRAPGMNCSAQGNCESLSMGFEFTTAGARILGVAAP
jgi:hypothetical protein